MPVNDHEWLTQAIGRPPRGPYEVVLRVDPGAEPAVLRTAPILDDGSPMPTRFYLVHPTLVASVSRVESLGGVRAADAQVDPDALVSTHQIYAAERDDALSPDYVGPRPYGGVGGTGRGVKCLHAHVANWLVGRDDPVALWTLARLDEPARQLLAANGYALPDPISFPDPVTSPESAPPETTLPDSHSLTETPTNPGVE